MRKTGVWVELLLDEAKEFHSTQERSHLRGLNKVKNRMGYALQAIHKDTTLQPAKTIFEEKVQEIISKLVNEWKFEEKENSIGLHRKEFQAIRKYKTLRIRMLVVAFDSRNSTQVDFTLEQL